MVHEMAIAIYGEIIPGNKRDEDWMSQAFQVASDWLNADFQICLTKDNVKNRFKTWMKHYAVNTDIKDQSGLIWDEDKKMVRISAENLKVWNEYVQLRPSAKGYENKVIENWKEIDFLCGMGWFAGERPEDIDDADEMLETEEEI